jgi:phosphoribosylanthranilate isomerase
MSEGVRMVTIKICGLTREQDIDAVNIALPDYIGFVFAESRRRIDEEKAKTLKACLDPSVKAVGVFVNEKIKNIVKLCRDGVIDLVQLHGDENREYINELKNEIANKIIKAIRVKDASDIEKGMELSCDYLLLDAYHEGSYGGTGKTFDRSLIPVMDKPFFIAGGIHCGNMEQAVKECRPYGIDVSSSVETNGYKDPKKIKEIVAKAREL